MADREADILGFPVLVVCVALLCGCTQLGPRSINRDRFDYSSAVADSWKQQALLNIVKLRYADNLVFVDVAQIVSGYTLQSTVSGGFGHNIGPSAPIRTRSGFKASSPTGPPSPIRR